MRPATGKILLMRLAQIATSAWDVGVAAQGVANLFLVLLAASGLMAWRRSQETLEATKRRVLRALRSARRAGRQTRVLTRALNTTVAQYRALRMRGAVRIPPPLTLANIEGDDPESWSDDGHKTQVFHGSATREIKPSEVLIRNTNRRDDD